MIISHNQVESVINLYKSGPFDKLKPKDRAEDTDKSIKQAAGAPSRDVLNLSEEAGEYRVAYRALARVPEIREEKVARLEQEIREGTYSIDGQVVAEKIIDRLLVDKLV